MQIAVLTAVKHLVWNNLLSYAIQGECEFVSIFRQYLFTQSFHLFTSFVKQLIRTLQFHISALTAKCSESHLTSFRSQNSNASYSVTLAILLNYSFFTDNLLNNEYTVLIRISMSCFTDNCFQASLIQRYLWRTQCCSNKCVSCSSSLVNVIMVKFSKRLWKVFVVLCFCCSRYVCPLMFVFFC